MDDDLKFWIRAGKWVTGFAIVLIICLMVGCPQYRVYNARLTGEAVMAEAEGSRKALIAQAEAERDAAKARVEAIRMVGEAAKEFPEYRQQEFIGAFADAMREGKINQIIYVPTEANIPIMEAGRIKR